MFDSYIVLGLNVQKAEFLVMRCFPRIPVYSVRARAHGSRYSKQMEKCVFIDFFGIFVSVILSLQEHVCFCDFCSSILIDFRLNIQYSTVKMIYSKYSVLKHCGIKKVCFQKHLFCHIYTICSVINPVGLLVSGVQQHKTKPQVRVEIIIRFGWYMD